MEFGEFNIAGIFAGILFAAFLFGAVFMHHEWGKFKDEMRKSMEWWER